MPLLEVSQHAMIRKAVEQSLAARNRYTEQVVNALTDDLEYREYRNNRGQVTYYSDGDLFKELFMPFVEDHRMQLALLSIS